MSVAPNPPTAAGVRSAGSSPAVARILRVLLVGAAPQTKWLLESGLSANRHMTRAVLRDAANSAEAAEAGASGQYDAVLIDLGADPAATLGTVTELSAKLPRDVPILVLGADNEAIAAEASIRGAHDYIVKDREGVKVLSRALHYAIERKRAEAHIHQLTTFDKLTGLPNRDWVQIQLRQSLESAEENGTRFAVILLDLDRFKLINDTLGHGRGDKLLRDVSARVRAAVGHTGSVARLGGDEFAVLTTPLADAAEAGAIADTILKSLAKPFVLEGHDVFVTASIGISIFPNDGADADALLTNADAAMYKAKDQGRNQAQFHILGTYGAAIRRLTLETELRHAFEREQLTLAYQPQFDGCSGKMVAAEALLRWNHPENGPVSPAEFIPIAEETGLILPLGEWVLMKACAEAKAWRNAGWRDAIVAVNVSPRQLVGPQLTEAVKKALAAAELPPEALEIEVTEGSLMLNSNDALSILLEIAALGVRIAVDDFGAGYSSLARLKKFPIGTLKIDRSFIMNLTSHDGDAAIVRAIIAMAKSLGVRTVAEGVETEPQLALLNSEGCDLIQGFLLSRPISGEDMHKRIAAKKMTAR